MGDATARRPVRVTDLVTIDQSITSKFFVCQYWYDPQGPPGRMFTGFRHNMDKVQAEIGN